MSQDTKVHAPQTKGLGEFFHRLFGGNGHESPGSDVHSGRGPKATLDLGDIQGFILRGYRMPMVRHFLLTVGVPAAHSNHSERSSQVRQNAPRWWVTPDQVRRRTGSVPSRLESITSWLRCTYLVQGR